MPDQYDSFDVWWNETENFSTRGERAAETLGPDAWTWLITVWKIAHAAGRREAKATDR